MRPTTTLVSIALTTAALAACGSSARDTEDHRSGDQPPSGDAVFHEEQSYVVRGRWTVGMAAGEDGAAALQLLASRATGSQPMGATVAADVQFELAADNFVTPAPVGVASYGTLDVTKLRDNDTRVCGAGGTTQCTTAALRVYTTGKPGAGLWNAALAYGLPISTSGHVIGLDSAGAYAVTSVPVNGAHVLKLDAFTPSARYAVPVSVDFNDAAAGSYATTLVLEYVLQ